ncbi:MAG: ATP-binding protein [Oscillospiraceae bacterium]|nr:ATP-binding protein [Oscillospiraceae bacterium]
MSIGKRILIPMISLTIGCGIAVLLSSIVLFNRELNNTMDDKVNTAMSVAENTITDLKERARLAVGGMANNPELVQALINDDRDTIVSMAITMNATTQIDYCTVLDNEGRVIFRTHEPELFNDNIAHLPHIKQALNGENDVFIMQGVTIRLGISAGAPVYDENMNIVGAVTLGFRLDNQDFADNLSELIGCEVTVFSNDERVSTTIKNQSGDYALGTNAPEYISEKVLAGETYINKMELFGRNVLAKYAPLEGADKEIVGMLFIGYYTEEDTAKTWFFMFSGMLILLAVLFICIIIARGISGIIGKQLNDMMDEVRKARDTAQIASKAKSVFLANMSHEIRTPMNSIVGFSELALDDNVSPKTKDYLTNIVDNSQWLLQVVNDILDISKIESGKMELEKIPFSLPELFISCRTMVMQKAEDKGLLLHFYAEPSTGKLPLGDPVRLRQVLTNLLSNAVKFTNTGIIKLYAAIIETTEDTITISFEVKDSGIGMTPEQIERVFDPFTQAESGTTRKYGGTGLGLAITKNILELMGGCLIVESMPEVGSKFSFELTFDVIELNDDDIVEKIVTHSAIEKPTFEGEILLCEDNVLNQQVICEHLTRVGLKTVVAENGKVGLDMVSKRLKKGEKQFDLIFMDMHMPVMDGLEACEKILELDTGIPIVALTANVMSHDREIYKKAGMVDYVGKPFTSQELWQCLLKHFEPVTWQKEALTCQEKADNELRQKLINNFVNNNKDIFARITTAINTEDFKLAHRLIHTLRSNAGQLNKPTLQKIAEDIEFKLRDGKNEASPEMLNMLEKELGTVLSEFSLLMSEPELPVSITAQDFTIPSELAEELKTLLKKGDPACLKFSDELKLIEGSGELIQKMERFDFKSALEILEKGDVK